ncbi:deoxynucleoside kinase [Acinetobacter baumannii]|nr:deoxynucleoside kinase [Acinetobacter baumannii]MDC5547785.1 deoxynucleoside kinase [Acinetobacter baumannii]MDX7929027.1 deoxynucleoside kinase [Acinetobacter baumannii]
MIVAFEGLPYAGKSTLIGEIVTLATNSRSIHCIPEIVLSSLIECEGPERKPARLEMYLQNDLLKSQIYESFSEDSLVLVDRCFISTVVGDTALSDCNHLSDMLTRLSFYQGIVLPDVIVYLDTSLETILERAELDNKQRLVGPWCKKLEYIQGLYELILSTIEQNNISKVYRAKSAFEVNELLNEVRISKPRKLSNMNWN